MLPLVVISAIGGMLLLIIYFDNIYFIPFAAPIPILLFRFLQKKISKTTSFLFKTDGIIINRELFKYSEIEGYRWDTNLTMDGLGINLKNGKVLHFTISKLDKPKINFKRFVETFNTSLREDACINDEMNYNVIYKKKIWFLKPMFWILSLMIVVFFVYAIINGIEIPSRFYLLPLILFILYLKAFK